MHKWRDVASTVGYAWLGVAIAVPLCTPVFFVLRPLVPSNGEGIDDTSGYTAWLIAFAITAVGSSAWTATARLRKRNRPGARRTGVALALCESALLGIIAQLSVDGRWPEAQQLLLPVFIAPAVVRIAVIELNKEMLTHCRNALLATQGRSRSAWSWYRGKD